MRLPALSAQIPNRYAPTGRITKVTVIRKVSLCFETWNSWPISLSTSVRMKKSKASIAQPNQEARKALRLSRSSM
jgi:hypothetical protein